jgi:hypothetical protein
MANEEKSALLENKLKKEAEAYFDKYRPQMEALEHSLLAKVRGGRPSISDYYALGKQLEQYDMYQSVCEEEGSVNLLGKIPVIAYDVITAIAGVSVIPIIASVQPIDEERGTVYFKDVRAATTKGSVTAGEVITDPRSNIVTPAGFSNNSVVNEVDATTAASTLTYNFTLAQYPARTQTVTINLQNNPAIYAIDDGNGNLVGVGLSGTINYLTGAVSVTFAVQPATGLNIYSSYQISYEDAPDLPQIDTFFNSVAVTANVYALKGTIGLLQSYGMRRRFGLVAEDELAKDLVAEVNREIGGDLIRILYANAQGNTTWDKNPPSTNISYFEHKQTFKDALADAESVLVGNAGRGTISQIICGRQVAGIISTLPGFEKLTDGTTLGVHVFGMLDGITVVRCPNADVLASNIALLVWKGLSPFEAPVVYAPYMPLVVTATLPVAPNPLQQMKAAAVWAGVQSLVPNFVTLLTVNDVSVIEG